jgi:hypothetical protein
VIVRQSDSRVQLITQPDHAHLAGRIMQHASGLAHHPRRAPILRAVAEHDNGWAEEDALPRVHPGTGVILDFVNGPLSVRHGVWPRAVARLAHDPWAAALVAQHAITVYDRFRPEREWTPFFAEMEDERDAMLHATGLPLEDLLPDYAFVRLGDLISLTFCTGWTDEQRFEEWTVELAGDHVLVTPDPFDGLVISIEVEARDIPARSWGSSGELQEALRGAEPRMLRGIVEGRQLTRSIPQA